MSDDLILEGVVDGLAADHAVSLSGCTRDQFEAGDVIQIDGVHSRNPHTDADTGHALHLTVTHRAPVMHGLATLRVHPALRFASHYPALGASVWSMKWPQWHKDWLDDKPAPMSAAAEHQP
jgi:hypothetical protein